MNRDRLKKSIVANEGYRQRPYQDHLGIWTVGYGHNINEHRLDTLTRLGTVGELMGWLSSKNMHESWLDADIDRAIADSIRWIGDGSYQRLTDAQREVIAEMAYQMGLSRLAGFVNFRQAILRGDTQAAASEMLASKWARQTPRRAEDLHIKWLHGV
jgi:lysozyme